MSLLDSSPDACDAILEDICVVPSAVMSDQELALPPRAALSRIISPTNRNFLVLSDHEWETKFNLEFRYYGNYSCKLEIQTTPAPPFYYDCSYTVEKCSEEHWFGGLGNRALDYRFKIEDEHSKDSLTSCARPTGTYCELG